MDNKIMQMVERNITSIKKIKKKNQTTFDQNHFGIDFVSLGWFEKGFS